MPLPIPTSNSSIYTTATTPTANAGAVVTALSTGARPIHLDRSQPCHERLSQNRHRYAPNSSPNPPQEVTSRTDHHNRLIPTAAISGESIVKAPKATELHHCREAHSLNRSIAFTQSVESLLITSRQIAPLPTSSQNSNPTSGITLYLQPYGELH